MNLITITKSTFNGEEVNSVNSRDIYNYLGVATAYSNWIKRAIEKYDFRQGEDFIDAKNGIGQNMRIDYIVSLDMAKELCMVSNTEKGRETRKYFIQAEKQATKPMTFLETAEQLVASLKRVEVLKLENRELDAKNNILMHTNKTYNATEIAKELGFKSAVALNKFLHDEKIQYKNNGTWVLYSKYSDMGLTMIKQTILDNDKEVYHTRWTQLGREFLLGLINE